jgi:menaquinone-dependent protoporphyrinogen oxidase
MAVAPAAGGLVPPRFPAGDMRPLRDDAVARRRDSWATMTVLVAFASKYGATAAIADAIASRLGESGLSVDCREAGDVTTIEPYDAVVLGSAVYMKRWRVGARRFLRRHAHALAKRPLWVFSSGPVGDPAHDDPAWTEPSRTMRRVEHLGARDHVVFGGRVPADPQGPLARAMAEQTPPDVRDRRDWDAIRAWADSIAAVLRAGA